jgi:hypothetical protein
MVSKGMVQSISTPRGSQVYKSTKGCKSFIVGCL